MATPPTTPLPPPPYVPQMLPGADDFIKARARARHDCADHLPSEVPAEVEVGDRWRCPVCRRRWVVSHLSSPEYPRDPFVNYEGVRIDGPDGSAYWRPFRCRFIGNIHL